MKTKSVRPLLLAAVLALVVGCQNNNGMNTADIVNMRESYQYQGPNSGFYDPWYGGSGAYMSTGGYYGGAGIGISVPVIR